MKYFVSVAQKRKIRERTQQCKSWWNKENCTGAWFLLDLILCTERQVTYHIKGLESEVQQAVIMCDGVTTIKYSENILYKLLF